MKKKKVIIGIIAAILILGAFGCGSTEPNTSTSSKTDAPKEQAAEKEKPAEKAPEPEPAAEPQPEPEPAEPQATVSQKNALRKAESYLSFTAFSYTGLIDQLQYEQFSYEDAVYAVDNCGADWNQQAAKKAQEYLEWTAFSHQGLVDQLVYEGFTYEEAEFGVTAAGL